jgi:Calponin homology (CH) domain
LWEENTKLVMGLIWKLILFYQVSSGGGEDEEGAGGSVAEEVLEWVNARIAPFDVQVNDLTSSFQDGLAFSALVASLDAAYERQAVAATPSSAAKALKSAEQRLAVPALVEAADLMDLDHKVVLTYLGMMYDKFGHLPPDQPAVQRCDHTVVRGTVRGRPQSLAPPPAASLFVTMHAQHTTTTAAAPQQQQQKSSHSQAGTTAAAAGAHGYSGAGFAREHVTAYSGGYDGVATAPPPLVPARDGAAALAASSPAEAYTPPDRSAPPPPPPGVLLSSSADTSTSSSTSSSLAPPGLPLAAVSPAPSPNSSPRSKEVTIEYEDPIGDEDFPDMDITSAEYAEFTTAKCVDIDKLYFVIDYPRSRFRLGGMLTIEIHIKDNHGRKVKNHGSVLEAQIEGPSGLIVLQAEKVPEKFGLWEVNFAPSVGF